MPLLGGRIGVTTQRFAPSKGHVVSESPSHDRPTFDDPNLVSVAGLVPALRLGESAGLCDLLAEQLSVDSPNPTAKTACVGRRDAGRRGLDR
jgi:hypothetical protein